MVLPGISVTVGIPALFGTRYRSRDTIIREIEMGKHAKTRIVALVGPLNGERRAVQTANHPLNPDEMLPVPDIVLLVSDDDTTAMVFRYTAHGEFGGDTYHASVDEAKEDTEAEYEDALLAWEDVPEQVGDAHAFAVRYAYERLKNRDGF
jgi:hypothetical protein